MRRILGAIADYIRECDKVLFLLCILASGYGCVAVLSATQFIGTNRQFMTQALALVLGLVAAIVASGVDYRKLAKWWPVLAVVGVVPVLLTFYVGYAPAGTDDKAWLALPGGMYFQPAELMKLAFMITFAAKLPAS